MSGLARYLVECGGISDVLESEVPQKGHVRAMAQEIEK